jgi:hypothetical protein
MNRLFLPLFLFLAPGSRTMDAQRAEARESPPTDVMVLAEFIEVSQQQLTALMGDPVLVRNGTKLRERLQVMIKAGEAVIIETAAVRVKRAARANAVSCREWIYATEYEPPILPGNFGGQRGLSGKAEVGHAGVPQIPTAFETKYVGSSLEAEVVVSADGRSIELEWACGLVSLQKINSFGKRRAPAGHEFDVLMPEFASMEPRGRIDVPDGGYVLAALGKRDAAKDAHLLVMIRCDVLQ